MCVYMYICVCVCICMCIYMCVYVYMLKKSVHFQVINQQKYSYMINIRMCKNAHRSNFHNR